MRRTPLEIDRLYQEGVAALRKGAKETAQEKLKQVVQADPLHEQAWLWLSGAVNTNDERIICLQNVLTINPQHDAARKGLEKLGVDPPPLPEEKPPLPVSPPPEEERLFTGDMHAMVDGRTNEITGEDDHRGESWRDGLYSPDYEGAFLSKKETPKRALLDLSNVWVDLMWFNTAGEFDDEVKYGGFGHIAVNVIAAGILQILASLVLFFILAVAPNQNFQPLLLRSINELGNQSITLDAQDAAPAESISFFEALEIIGVDTSFEFETPSQESLAVAGIIGTMLLLSMALAIPLMFIREMYRSLITSFVAGWLQGKGDAIKTMHAFTLALVAAGLINLVMSLVYPFVSLGMFFVLAMMVSLYQFMVQAVALSRVQKFGLLASMGTMVIARAGGSTLASLGLFGISMLLS